MTHETHITAHIPRTEEVVDHAQRLADKSSPRAACLVVLSGLRFGALVRVPASAVLGREQCDLTFPDGDVSRRHARITCDGERCRIEDLGSANGTWVNGQRLVAPHTLAEGDRIHLGPSTLLRFALHDGLEEAFQQRLGNATLRDPVSGAYNLRYFLQRLAGELSHAHRHQRPLAVVVLDVDRLGELNACQGHGAGDALLYRVATHLERAIRSEDVLARVGADEFAILCRDTPCDGARALADRLRLSAARALRITLCAGIAAFPVVQTRSPERFLRAADAALFLARRLGPNHCAVHAPIRLEP